MRKLTLHQMEAIVEQVTMGPPLQLVNLPALRKAIEKLREGIEYERNARERKERERDAITRI